jgi:hypothetical protein
MMKLLNIIIYSNNFYIRNIICIKYISIIYYIIINIHIYLVFKSNNIDFVTTYLDILVDIMLEIIK